MCLCGLVKDKCGYCHAAVITDVTCRRRVAQDGFTIPHTIYVGQLMFSASASITTLPDN